MLFPADFMTRLEYLSLMSRRVFRGQLLAQRRTRETGAGIEFADHREYAAGDDLRYLDWNIYARHGDLLIRRFQEEQDLHVYLLLDCSRSMSFENGSKFDLARQVAAALAYIALADLDCTALFAFSAGITARLPLTRGREQILPIMRFLESLTACGSSTGLTQGVAEFLHLRPRPGLVIMISDLFDPGGIEQPFDLLRFRGFDVHAIQIFHELEARPQLVGDAQLVDLESGSETRITVTEQQLADYHQLFTAHQTAVRNYCRRYGLGCTQSPASSSFDALVMTMMNSSAGDQADSRSIPLPRFPSNSQRT